jgi:hypothetical protein
MPGNKFNLHTIVGHIKDSPLLKPNRFEVIISGPVDIARKITFNCHRCDIPTHTIGSFEHSLIGPKRKIPNEETFDDISMSFYNNKYLDEVYAITQWIKLIGGNSSWRMAYHNDIVGSILINVYDLQEHIKAEINIYDAYPIGISELELSYAGELPSDITINWAYHSFEIFQVSEGDEKNTA